VPEPTSAPARSRLGSLAVAIGIAASRVAGLVRVAVVAYFFGAGLHADVFAVGLRLPNLLQNLLGEGTLSASFIPVYAELTASGKREEAGRVAGAVFSLLLALAFGLALLGVLLAPIEVALVMPGWEGEQYWLTVTVVRWMFPMTGVLVLSAWALGIQNSHRRFLLSYLAPVVWNAAMIGTLVVCGGLLGWEGRELLLALAVGALGGAVLQFLVQIPRVLALEPHLRIRWAPRMPEVREIVRNAGPAVFGRGVVQVSGYVDTILASFLAVGAASAISYAQAIYLLPISLFGMSVAAAELPELARERNAAQGVLAARARAALDQVAFFVVPSTVALVGLGDVVLGLLKRGEFDENTVLLVWATLAAYSVGLPASTASRILSSSFYALRDTRTPARIATTRLFVSAAVALLAMSQLEPVFGLPGGWFSEVRAGPFAFGAAGLALGTGAAAWVEWALLRRGLSRALGGLSWNVGFYVRLWGTALLAGAAAWGLRQVLPPIHPILEAAVVLGLFGVVYLGGCAALGIGEAGRLVRRVLRR
jgi:putative peptidoglycan lipid II flippase